MNSSTSFQLPGRLPLVGRTAELEMLRSGYDDMVTGGSGRVYLVEGEPGIGKTRLAEELIAHVRRAGGQAYWGRCLDDAGAPAYWPWIQLLRAYARDHPLRQLRLDLGSAAADIARVVPELGERLPGLPAPPLQAEHARFRLFDGVATFLSNAGHRQALVLVLDDLHWADESSLLLTQFVAGALAESRLFILATYRAAEQGRSSGQSEPLARLLGALAREPVVKWLALRGFSAGEVEAFFDLVTGARPPAALLDAMVQATDGNPFFVTEVVRFLAAEGWLFVPSSETTTRVPLPPSVRVAIGRRLDQLPARSGELLRVGALIGREFRLPLLARVSGLPVEAVLESLEAPLAARLIVEVPGAAGRYSFAHALVREALVAATPASRRARLHGQIGEVLEETQAADSGTRLAALAYHFTQALLAESAGDSIDRGVSYAVQAAEHASRLLAFEEAARYYELALRALEQRPMVDNQQQRCDLLLALGEAQQRAGDTLLASSTFALAASLAGALHLPEQLARAALGRGGAVVTPGVCDRALIGLLGAALAVLDDSDAALRSRLLARYAMELYWTAERDHRAALGRDSVAPARGTGEPGVLGFALYAYRFAIWDPHNLPERLAVATELVVLGQATKQPELSLQGYRWRIPDALEAGDIQTADNDLAASEERARESRQPFYLWLVAVFHALRALFDGRLAHADALVEHAFALGQRVQPGTARIYYGAQLFALRREQARLGEVEPLLGNLAEQYPPMPIFRAYLALVHVETDRRELAGQQLARLAPDNFGGVPRDALWLGTITVLAEVCARLNDAPHAATLHGLLLPFSDRNVVHGVPTAVGSARRYLGLLETTLARWDEAEANFLAATRINAAWGARLAAAWSQHDHAAMLARRGRASDQERARALIDEALVTSDTWGFVHLAQCARKWQAKLADVGQVATRPAQLSPREVEVLQFVAAGYSNQDIANTLVISMNTVIRHVSNILAKTGTANRAEAAVFAVRHGLVSHGSV